MSFLFNICFIYGFYFMYFVECCLVVVNYEVVYKFYVMWIVFIGCVRRNLFSVDWGWGWCGCIVGIWFGDLVSCLLWWVLLVVSLVGLVVFIWIFFVGFSWMKICLFGFFLVDLVGMSYIYVEFCMVELWLGYF